MKEIEEMEQIEKEREVKSAKEFLIEYEKSLIDKYGSEIYQKLKNGHYWIGMNKEMA